MAALAAALGLAVAVAGCGDANVVTPTDVTQSYVSAIGEGNFPGACALLTPPTRSALLAGTGERRGCAALLDRCVPNRIRVLAADQTQLLYVNVDIEISHSRAQGSLTGLPVAHAIGHVALVRQHGRWRLTEPGGAISRCVRRLRARAAHRDRPHSTHG